MFPLTLINPRVWVELAILAACCYGGWYAYDWAYARGAAGVQARWDRVEAQRATESARVALQALQTTKDLQTTVDSIRSTKDAQISSLNSTLASAVAGLSNRPSRADQSGVPGHAGASTGCYPSQLYREDSAVVIKLAGEADKLRSDLQQCYAQYQAARNTVMGTAATTEKTAPSQ